MSTKEKQGTMAPSARVLNYTTIGNPRPAWATSRGDLSEEALLMVLLSRDRRARWDHDNGHFPGLSLREICDAYDELIEAGFVKVIHDPDQQTFGLDLSSAWFGGAA